MVSLDAQHDIDSFCRDARRFLDENAPLRPAEAFGIGDDGLSSYRAVPADVEADNLARARAWKALEFDAGFGWITGPQELGGAGRDAESERAYLELRSLYAVPSLGAFTISLGMVAPSFLAFGGDEVRAIVPRLWRGDLIGCQLFSEPTNGSDVAGLITRATRDGDSWLINGQKVWTSGAHHADWGLLLARTDPIAPKHGGITAFALDMRLPGVTVRPLTMMTGGTEFNEVFLDDVRLPDTYRLGEVNSGWRVAIATLMNERALGAAGSDLFGLGRCLARLRSTVEQDAALRGDPVIRQELARVHSMAEMIRYQALAADQRRRAGRPPGPAESVFKLANTEALRRVVQLAGHVLGPHAVADGGRWGAFAWADMISTVSGMRIAGGTDEVMRNILAERVLGLPKEPTGGATVAP